MNKENDWRLTGQERFLRGKTLIRRTYHRPSPTWDHDHCVFCWAKFMEAEAGDYQEGYVTEDGYYWICPLCFDDFKDKFQWTVKEM